MRFFKGKRFSRKFLHGFPTLKLSVLNVFHCPFPSAIDIAIVRAPAANIPREHHWFPNYSKGTTTEPYNRKCKQGYRTATQTLPVTTPNGTAIPGNNLAVSYKVKHTFTT